MLDELIATTGVREIHREGGPVGVMALHGGLEEGTAVMAEAVSSATKAALYAVVQPKTLWWHIPSIRYDPAHSRRLARFLRSVQTAFSLHGYGEPGFEETALLGGNNRGLAEKLRQTMAARGVNAIADMAAIPKRLRGVHRLNPVNRPAQAGVQVELPMALRTGNLADVVVEALVEVVAAAQLDLTANGRAG